MDIKCTLILLLFPLRSSASPDCDSFDDCVKCTTHKTWSGDKCRWCPLDRECHAYVSSKNSCRKEQNIVSSNSCAATSKPYGIYNPQMAYLNTLLSALAYSDDPERCVAAILPDDGFKVIHVIGQRCEDFSLFEYEECYAYTAVSHTMRTIVLAYRGTTNTLGNQQLYDEIVSVLLTPKTQSIIGGEVQYYFKSVYDKLSPCVHQSLNELLTQHPEYDVLVTGHSLGGAVASLSAAALIHQGIVQENKLSLYTFGMPRVGDKGYAFNHDKIVNNSWRVVHARDIVAHLPTCNLALGCRVTPDGPYHHGREIFYPDSEMTQSSDYKQCQGDEDERCSNGAVSKNGCVPGLGKCIKYHKYYFDIPVGTYCSEKLTGRKRRDAGRSLMWETFSSKRCKRITLAEQTARKQNSTTKTANDTSKAPKVQELPLILVLLVLVENVFVRFHSF